MSKDKNISSTLHKVPFIVTSDDIGSNIEEWFIDHPADLDRLLRKHGALLFRNFKINGVRHFERLISASGEQLLDYRNRSTPRSRVRGNVFTSTEYPANEQIPLHSENSYTNSWAMKIFFFCIKAAETGGETPIADNREIYSSIDKSVRDELTRKKIRYVRNYGNLDLPWQEVFQTENKLEMEAWCKSNNIEFEWLGNTQLRTWQVCDAVAAHPLSNEMVWFNQAHLFHVSNLGMELSQSLLSSVGEEGLPRNAYFGDGTSIDEDFLNELRRVYAKAEIVFPWYSGDLLILDNMLFAHGRKPYTGPRQVLVGMTNETTQKVQPSIN